MRLKSTPRLTIEDTLLIGNLLTCPDTDTDTACSDTRTRFSTHIQINRWVGRCYLPPMLGLGFPHIRRYKAIISRHDQLVYTWPSFLVFFYVIVDVQFVVLHNFNNRDLSNSCML